ncbi:MAG: hypothetical protein OSJ70_01280 [Bacilli bacterium]|nr:hypothetical protein [Bacilli bacterium]
MTKKMKRLIWGVLLIVSFFSFSVKALENEEIYYENDNGVRFTKSEYDFVSEFYYDGYQKFMTVDNYQRLKEAGVMLEKVKKVVYNENNGIQTLTDVTYQSASKKLLLSYVCTSRCYASFQASWLTIANVRSYDLIGVYSPTANVLEAEGSSMAYSNSAFSPVEKNNTKNGISSTFKLPTTDAKYVFTLDFNVPKGTKVYASYQHAKKSISLANSRKYTYASSGYGGVFKFDSSVSSYYDGMGGVNTTLS